MRNAKYIALSLILILLQPAWAEEPTDNPLFNDANQFPQGTIQPEQQGRRDKGNSANVAAIVGAAVAGAMCALMMAKAQQMPEGPEKDQMMMQALQQCAQAAQNAANAAQNKDGADQLTDKPTTPPSTLPNATGELAKNDSKDNIPQLNLGGEDQPEIQVPEIEDPAPIADIPDIQIPGDGGSDLTFGGDALPELPGTSIPNPVKTPKLTVDESGDKNSPQSPSPGSSTLLASNSFANDGSSEKELEAIGIDALDLRHKKDAETDYGTSGGAGGGDGGEEGNDFLSAFMAGAGEGGGLDGGLGGSGELIQLPASANPAAKKPKVNIFEYAKFRYKKLAYKQGRIQTRVFVARPFTQPQTASLEH